MKPSPSNLSGHVSNPLSYDRLHVGQSLSSFTEVTIDEVRKLLTSMPAKSLPVDFVPTSVIKACPELFAEIIARLANISFGEGCFRKKFRSAMVRALLKKEGFDRNAPCNYRPISNLNTLSKVLERLATTAPHHVTKLQQSTVGLSTKSLHRVDTVENARYCI